MRFSVSFSHNTLFHFSRKQRSVSKKRAAQKTRFSVSFSHNTLFHFFEISPQSQIWAIFILTLSNDNNLKCRSEVLLPTPKKKGTFLRKIVKPLRREIRDPWLIKSYHLPNYLVSTQKTYFRTLFKIYSNKK